MCVREVVAMWYSGSVLGSGPEVPEFRQISICLLPAPPVHPAVCVGGPWHLLGYKFKGFSHETAMVQVGLRVPTPLAVRKGLSS